MDPDTRRILKREGIRYDEAEVDRLFREWDLDVVRDMLPDFDGPVMSEHDELEVLTIAELARLAKQHRATIHKAITEGRLRVVRPGGTGRPRITLAEARRYLHGGGDNGPTPIRPH